MLSSVLLLLFQCPFHKNKKYTYVLTSIVEHAPDEIPNSMFPVKALKNLLFVSNLVTQYFSYWVFLSYRQHFLINLEIGKRPKK